MKIRFTDDFYYLLNQQLEYIAKDKPLAARKFKKDLIIAIKKDLNSPFNFKKSIYFNDNQIRDYVFKGYTIVYKIQIDNNSVEIFEFIKYMEKL